MLPFYLATKEMVRNKRRFATIFGIVALITLLVLFTSALGDGLAQVASEYFERIGADLILSGGCGFSVARQPHWALATQ